jgi:hypothetical protein
MYKLINMRNTKRTRFKLAMISMAFLAFIATTSMFKEMEQVTMTSLGGFLIIGGVYLWAESSRPSKKESDYVGE